MNFSVPNLPEREEKPRQKGLTMMMDKGLSLRETENFCDAASEYTDIVKFGFGTAVITKNLEEKIKVYKQANIPIYFGGTLFEIFIVRGKFEEFRKLVDTYKL
jgi:phosphosulfolactate synthase